MPFSVPNLQEGLNKNQAKDRLETVGLNQFEKPKPFSLGKLVFQQFRSPLIYVLMIAAATTFLLGEYLDAFVISLVVVVNASLGFWQEFKAAKSLEALKNYLKPQITVLREGKKQEIGLQELVPGDIVFLDTGGSIPADGVVTSAQMLVVNEAVLTGESRPVDKTPYNLKKVDSLADIQGGEVHDDNANKWVFMGTNVSAGIGQMLIVRTGNETQMGKIAKSLSATSDEETPLQKQLAGLARILMFLVVGITAILFPLGIYQGVGWLEMFETAVAVAVAAIPEGLAVSMTVILAIGMQRILSRKALVRKLVAAETLGSVSVICCDKTGTLTKGKMQVVDYIGKRDLLVRSALFANDDRDEESKAMVEWVENELKQKKLIWTKAQTVHAIRQAFGRVAAIPFSSANKYAASLNQGARTEFISLAGAPEIVMERCSLKKTDKEKITESIHKLASQGYRIIGFAGKVTKDEKKLTDSKLQKLEWYGLLAFADPLRPKVKEALSQARLAGVKVKVITGDYKETAIAVLEPVLGQLSEAEVITGPELAKMTESELRQRIPQISLFARTSPEQKLVIVNALKEANEVVAMTGDGVNDAPALKAADIGVVVNEATDVSKQTADMVLLDSNFSTIVSAIREGRGVYDSIKKVVAYLLADTFQELILIGGSLILGLPLPVTAIQILWINLVEDSFLGIALAFDSSDNNVMKEKPRKRGSSILDSEIRTLVVIVGFASNLVLLGLYSFLLTREVALQHLQTFMFVSMASNSLMYIFSIKSLKKNIWNEQIFDNKFLVGAVGLGFILTFAAVYVPLLQKLLGTVPLSSLDILVVFALGLTTIALIEFIKWIFIHKKD